MTLINHWITFFLMAMKVMAEIPLEQRDVPELVQNVNDQFHNQNSMGQYKYGYFNGESSKEESRSLDGVTRGSYTYMDANGVMQKVVYEADAEHGFRVSGTNIPSAPLNADSTDEITPAFSTKLLPAARKISTNNDETQTEDTQNIPNDKKIIKNKISDENNTDKKQSVIQTTQQPDKVGGYHYLFPLAPDHDFSPHTTADYNMMSLPTNIDYYIPQNQMSSSQGYDFRNQFTYLPFFQPEFIPPFARSNPPNRRSSPYNILPQIRPFILLYLAELPTFVRNRLQENDPSQHQ